MAHYLNDVAARAGKGIKVWLVEAKAVRVDGSAWAPIFDVVAEPSAFTEEVAGNVSGYERSAGLEEVLAAYSSETLRGAASALAAQLVERGLKLYPTVRGGKHLLAFFAPGPSAGGFRSVLTSYSDGRIYISFSAYSGKNSGIAIPALTSEEFVRTTVERFSLTSGYSPAGWLTPDRVQLVLDLADTVIGAYKEALDLGPDPSFG